MVKDPVRKIHALLISWKEEDSSCWKNVECMGAIFRHEYKFTSVGKFAIPPENSHGGLQRKLSALIKNNTGPKNLFVVYYTCHCSLRDITNPRGRHELEMTFSGMT